MPEYLTPEWFAAADEALRADPSLAAASRGVHLVLQQTVAADGGGSDATDALTWHIRLEDGTVTLVAAPAADPTVTFTCDRETALEIHHGRTSAQAAFMAGHLRVGGDVGALLANQELLAGLTDVLAPLRTPVG